MLSNLISVVVQIPKSILLKYIFFIFDQCSTIDPKINNFIYMNNFTISIFVLSMQTDELINC